MKNLRITNGFEQLTDNNLIGRARFIHERITDEELLFPTPTPTMADFLIKINTFEDLVARALEGGAYERAQRDTKKDEVVTMLHDLGNYVLFTAKGNPDVVVASGFTPSKDKTPPQPVGDVNNLRMDNGQNPGEAVMIFDKVTAAKSYLYQYTQDPITPNSVWSSEPGTIRKNKFTGLESSKKYWFRVMAIGTGGSSAYSNLVPRVVQ